MARSLSAHWYVQKTRVRPACPGELAPAAAGPQALSPAARPLVQNCETDPTAYSLETFDCSVGSAASSLALEFAALGLPFVHHLT